LGISGEARKRAL